MKDSHKFWVLLLLLAASIALLVMLQHSANAPSLFQ